MSEVNVRANSRETVNSNEKAYIINVHRDEKKKVDACRVLVCSIIDGSYSFKKFELSEEQVVGRIMSGVPVVNAKVVNGHLCGDGGSFDRFQEGEKQFLILTQIKSADGRNLGYRMCDKNGEVATVKESMAIGMCKRVSSKGVYPIINAIFRSSDDGLVKDNIASYPDKPFEQEVLSVNKNKHAEKAKVDSEKQGANLKKLNDIFTIEQISELRKGKDNGVNIKIYANPSLSPKQMSALRRGLEKKVDVSILASPKFKVEAMEMYINDMRYGFDVSNYLSPKYSVGQIMELSIGFTDGVDISKYSDPSTSAEEMEQVRIRLEKGVWAEEGKVSKFME